MKSISSEVFVGIHNYSLLIAESSFLFLYNSNKYMCTCGKSCQVVRHW